MGFASPLSKISTRHGVNEVHDIYKTQQRTQSDKSDQNSQDNVPENLGKGLHRPRRYGRSTTSVIIATPNAERFSVVLDLRRGKDAGQSARPIPRFRVRVDIQILPERYRSFSQLVLRLNVNRSGPEALDQIIYRSRAYCTNVRRGTSCNFRPASYTLVISGASRSDEKQQLVAVLRLDNQSAPQAY
jgi:hypothetical protein